MVVVLDLYVVQTKSKHSWCVGSAYVPFRAISFHSQLRMKWRMKLSFSFATKMGFHDSSFVSLAFPYKIKVIFDVKTHRSYHLGSFHFIRNCEWNAEWRYLSDLQPKWVSMIAVLTLYYFYTSYEWFFMWRSIVCIILDHSKFHSEFHSELRMKWNDSKWYVRWTSTSRMVCIWFGPIRNTKTCWKNNISSKFRIWDFGFCAEVSELFEVSL